MIKLNLALDEIDSIFNTIDPMAEEACPFPDSNTIHLSLPCSFTHSILHSKKKKKLRDMLKKTKQNKTKEQKGPYQKIK